MKLFNIFVALALLQKEVCSTTPFGLKRGGGGAVSVSKNDASLLTPSSEPKDAGTTDEIDDDDALLMRDIEMLSSFLDDVVKKENPGAHELFSILRKHGLGMCSCIVRNKSSFVIVYCQVATSKVLSKAFFLYDFFISFLSTLHS